MFRRRRLSMPPPRPFPWPMRPLESARTTMTTLPDGRLVLTIQHAVLRGVTPAMLVWWFHHLGESMEHEGKGYPRYLVWHPRDHIHWELARRAADGGTGAGAYFRIVEAFGADPAFYVDIVDFVEKCDEEGLSLVQRRFGTEIFRLEHRFTAVEGGTQYDSRMVVGSAAPVLGWVFNRLLRPRLFPDTMARAWLRHNVEEVGNFEYILPPLYSSHSEGALAGAGGGSGR